MDLDNLTFDPVVVDTSLAEKYIESHKHFAEEPPKGRFYVFDNGSRMQDMSWIRQNVHGIYIHRKIRINFREKLKENFELFCQLEYLIRKTDAEDTRNQLNLILQYLECDNAVKYKVWTGMEFRRILVTKDTYLYQLGYGLHHPYQLCLITTIETAPLCYLFYEVCLHARINTILVYINHHNIGNMEELSKCITSEQEPVGCTAVYTEYADIDSAVDVLLYSSPKAPWRIHRVLVQESVYSAVIAALSAKGKRLTADRSTQYVEAFDTRRGTVAVTVGDVDTDAEDIVRVVTYRTGRELLDLLAARPTRFLSLWCEQSPQAEQLAEQANARYVWINTHADFDGPPEAALAVYTATWYPKYDMTPETYAQIARFNTKWSTLEWEERKTIILNTMTKFRQDFDQGKLPIYHPVDTCISCDGWEHNKRMLLGACPMCKVVLLKICSTIKNWKHQDAVQVHNNKITILLDNPEANTIYRYNSFYDYTVLLGAIDCLIRGYKVGLEHCSKHVKDVVSALNQVGIPIATLQQGETLYTEDIKLPRKLHRGNKKVIQRTYGTMFA